MTGINVGSILAGLTAYKAYNAFVWIGLVDADGVRVPVGGAQGWGACGGGDEVGRPDLSGFIPKKSKCICS